MSFESAVQKVLLAEGGYTNDPHDPGGETKYGISKRQYPDLDILNLTEEAAIQIYRQDYWNRLFLDLLPTSCIQDEIFDTAVNMGRRAELEIAQKACNYLGAGLDVDGVMGTFTLKALSEWQAKDEQALFVCLNGFQFMRYVELVNGNSDLLRYSRGWAKRIQQYPERG